MHVAHTHVARLVRCTLACTLTYQPSIRALDYGLVLFMYALVLEQIIAGYGMISAETSFAR